MSLPEASSGEVGCPPNEIEISDEADASGSETWTATCRGQRFYCTDQTSFMGGGYHGGGGVVHDVKCTPELEPVSSLPPPRPTLPPAPRLVEARLPRKAVGFRFGSTVEESQAACEVSGHGWSRDTHRFHCDGTPSNVGLPIVAGLGFCEGKLCDLTLLATLPLGNDGEEAFMTLWKSLRKQYGVPGIEGKIAPPKCQGKFVGCVATKSASWQAQWKWQSGERIVAKTLSENGSARIAVRYIFGEAERANPDAPIEGIDGDAF